MSHVLRVFALIGLLAPCGSAYAQSLSDSSLIAAQVERKVAEHPVAPALNTAAAPETTAPIRAELVTSKGKVLNEFNKPMAGVVVFAKDVAAIASTNADGEYSLQVPAGVNTLTFSYAGYEEQQLQASNFLPTTVRLLPAPNRRKLAKK